MRHVFGLQWLAVSIRICLIGLFLSDTSQAFPELVFARDFGALVGAPRTKLVVIYNSGTKDKPNFRMARPDIIPIDDEGHIIWYENIMWQNASMAPLDRIVLENSVFGIKTRDRFSFPGCSPKYGEMITSVHGVAWLVTCRDEVIKKIEHESMRLVYDEKKAEINSLLYNYKFKPENQMLFQSITLKGSPDFLLAADSDLYIKADIKNFFTLNFHASDIESKMNAKRFHPTVALASLGFYLKVLFFKISLDLNTDVAFFESSATIPMVMTLPVDASTRLNKKSGVLYSFKLGDAVDPKSLGIAMPLLDPSLLAGASKTEGLKNCTDECLYTLQLPAQNKVAKMEIVLPRQVVELGMFPWFVSDIGAATKEMGWKLPEKLDLKNRVGIYFEVSGLPKGSHPWDFKMSF